jgi:hypothetical protein
MRDHILSEIRRLATLNAGQSPGMIMFARETGIGEHQWRGKFWARWSDALAEAGHMPNEWGKRLDSDQVLSGVIAACRHYGHFQRKMKFNSTGKRIPPFPAAKR